MMDKQAKIDAYVAAACQATVEVCEFLEVEAVEIILGQQKTTPFEEALIGLYFRLVLWGRTLATLSDPNHLQAVRSGARAAFELYLDMYHLAARPETAAKMFAFSKVWKFNSASKLVALLKAHPELDEKVFRHQKTLVGDAETKQEYEALLDQFWPSKGDRKAPNDWYGRSIFDKAHDAGLEFELKYREEYGLASLFVHSGLVPIDNMSNDALLIAFARGHLNFKDYYLKSTAIVCQAMRVLEAKPSLQSRLRDLDNNQERILGKILAARDGIDLSGV
jgi:Family of unknown function (DUF5677)